MRAQTESYRYEVEVVRSVCRETLERNWRNGVRQADGVPFAYTRPSLGHYPFQWYWDSCFAAISWRRFDQGRSRRELESLLADGLLWIVQPDESGLDAPQFDAIWHGHADGLPGFVRLVRRNRAHGYDLRRIAADGGPVCCEVMTNVFHALSSLALGRPSLTGVIIERMYDDKARLFRPLARPHPREEPAVTWAALSPLALPDLPEAIARRLVEEHLLDPERFWLPVPPPSVPPTEPAFSPRNSTLGIKRYWRGPTWINAAWLLWLGLVRLGYENEVELLQTSPAETVAAQGLREYYDPYTGRGMGSSDFAWSALVMEILDPVNGAGTSFLPGP